MINVLSIVNTLGSLLQHIHYNIIMYLTLSSLLGTAVKIISIVSDSTAIQDNSLTIQISTIVTNRNITG